MVSIKKIGAIVTGALFVGATVGMAAAISMPSAFQSSMLASNGVAKAQLVVGKNAPGKIADTNSADVIKEAVASKLNVSGVGGDVVVSYGSDNLNEAGDAVDTWLSSSLSGNATTTLKLGTSGAQSGDIAYIGNDSSMKYDANGNGKVSDSVDYTLYDGVYVADGINGVVRFFNDIGKNKVSDFSTSTDTNLVTGDVVKIKGAKYAITSKSNWASGEISLGPAMLRTVSYSGTSPSSGNALVITGGYKVFYDVSNANSTNGTGALSFYGSTGYLGSYTFTINNGGNGKYANATVGGSAIVDNTTTKKLNSVSGLNLGDFGSKYNIYLVKLSNSTVTTPWVSMVFVDKDTTATVTDGQSGFMGYGAAWINHGGSSTSGKMLLLSDPLQLVKGGAVDVPGTLYEAKYSPTRGLNIKLKIDKSQPSGATWKSTKYSFLGENVNIKTSGGTAATPELAIVNEDTASSSMNHVLIGGPVANKMTAQLVESGASKVDWYNSSGNIEVVSGHPAAGMYSIIVAGKARTQTRAAADALAAWL
ncbi:hypothetical protein BMS3Bbin15_00542 [archaeon BMS3Bbin15]|nr:hypothetical protein BMS3Bbin15_00542 [archaeon BMS3Bbin15]